MIFQNVKTSLLDKQPRYIQNGFFVGGVFFLFSLLLSLGLAAKKLSIAQNPELMFGSDIIILYVAYLLYLSIFLLILILPLNIFLFRSGGNFVSFMIKNFANYFASIGFYFIFHLIFLIAIFILGVIA